MNYTWLILAVGLVGIAAYLVINSTSNNECSGGFFDAINPACIASGISGELNTLLIILAVVAVLVVGLLAFGPSTQHIAGAAALL